MKAIVILSALLLPVYLAAQPDITRVQLIHPPNGDMLHIAERKQLFVSGYSQFERWLSVVELNSFVARSLSVPNDAQYFSSAKLGKDPLPQLVFLGIDGVSVLSADESSARQLFNTTSIYRVTDGARLRQADFVVDLGAGRSDFLIADFNKMHLFRQTEDGQFNHFPLELDALVTTWRERPDYQRRQHFIADVNLDGLADLVFVRHGKFIQFLQRSDGSFSITAAQTNWPVTVSTEQEADQRNDAGRSFEAQYIDTLRNITDIDGDGLPDLVIDREMLADALERNNSFRIHYGNRSAQGLQFSTEPDTVITTDTSPIAVVIDDFNNDKRQDFYIPSTHFGVGTIIRVLLRGSANLDIDFFLLNTQRQYAEKADFRQQATIDVSISNLRYDMPLFLLADTDGNGKKSLLVANGDDEIKLYRQDNKRLFSRRSESLDVTLPRDARKARVFDLTGNGKEDVVLPFDAQEKDSMRNQLHLLFF